VDFYLYDPGNRELYVGEGGSNVTFAIDTDTNFLAANITWPHVAVSPGDTSLESMVYDPSNGKLFAVNFAPDLVSVIDGATNKIVANIAGIKAPVQGEYDPKNGDIYVQAGNGTIFLISGSTYQITGSIAVPAFNTSNLVYDPDNGLFYLAFTFQSPDSPAPSTESLLTINASSNTLSQQRIPLNSAGVLLLYDSFNNDLYLYGGATLTALSTESNNTVAEIQLPGVYDGPEPAEGGLEFMQPSFLYNPVDGGIYAIDVEIASGDIGVIHVSASSNTVVSKNFLPSSIIPGNLALDPTEDKVFAGGGLSVYVLDLSSGNASTVTLGSCRYHTPSFAI
jgi:YVTN family beta-propeller protein